MNKILALTAPALLLAACAHYEAAGPHPTATLRPASGSQVSGTLTFSQASASSVRMVGEITGHAPGLAGIHIHEKGDCSAPDATSAGGHFNPAKQKHGATPTSGHAGDMGNILFDASGRARVNVLLEGIVLDSAVPNGITGRAVVVHEKQDDLKTDPTGNSGARVACGVIG